MSWGAAPFPVRMLVAKRGQLGNERSDVATRQVGINALFESGEVVLVEWASSANRSASSWPAGSCRVWPTASEQVCTANRPA